MSWYYDYKPTIETDEGIKAKSKRGAFVKNWWASRWLKAMERIMDAGRLARGRRYARKGQVLSLNIDHTRITARVQGSRRSPYKVTIDLTPLPESNWQAVVAALAERPLFAAHLLAGEMPAEIEEAFAAVGVSLFPGRAEINQRCSCPDWAEVCKHLAAVHYILAERLDAEPFLLFHLRGKTEAEILPALGNTSPPTTAAEPVYAPAPPLVDALSNFWQTSPELAGFQTQIAPAETPAPILRRLGSPDFMPEARHWLAAGLEAAAKAALDASFSQPEDEVADVSGTA